MRFYILLLTVLLSMSSLQAQQRIRKLKAANDHVKAEEFVQALELYELLMSTNAGQGVMGVDAKINMADCYRMTDQVAKATPLYEQLLMAPNIKEERPDILLGYGEALLATGKYDEARGYFLQYADKRPDDPRGPDMVKRLDQIQSIVPLFDNVSIVFETAVNDTINDEFSPTYYGTGLVFVSDRVIKSDIGAEWGDKERSYLNMYYSDLTVDGHLQAPVSFSRRLNAANRHDGPATFSRDGQHCYYSQSAKSSSDATKYTLQLFASHMEEGDWNTPAVLEFVTEGYMFSHPCLSANGRELYFMSDMPGGFGGTDIWISKFSGGKWGKPENLGKDVNTDNNEAFPFIHPDGTLYFASKGHASYGGFDIFRSRPTGNGVDWTKAENIGEPFNSAFDDTYFLFDDDETKGFLSSAREGSDNIYSFVIVGAEPQSLPDGIMPRGGDAANFYDTTGISENAINDEALVDSLLNAGFKIEEPIVDPENPVDPNNNLIENPDNPVDPNNNVVENPNDPDNPYWDPDSPVVDNNDNPNKRDPDNTDNTDINNNWSNVNDPNDPNHSKKWTQDPNDPNNPPMLDTDPQKTPSLVVDLTVLDSKNNSTLPNAQVILRNELTGEEQTLTLDSKGMVSFKLKPDQKYIVRAECIGYFGSSLPISTNQAYEDQKVPASLPLIKK